MDHKPAHPPRSSSLVFSQPSPSSRETLHKPSTDTRELIERFPHLERIHITWGSAACRYLLNGLLWDCRGDRQGFPPEHARTIFSLLNEHDEAFPQFNKDLSSMGFGLNNRSNVVSW